MRHKPMPSTKSVHVAGREYLYFVTARLNAKGNPILVRLPARSSPQFGATYGALMGAMTGTAHVHRARKPLSEVQLDPSPNQGEADFGCGEGYCGS